MKDWIHHLSTEVIDQILENAFQWFVVVDRDAKILYINEEYCHFLEVKREKAIGQHVADIIENTEMHLVMQRGEADIAAPHYIKGTYMLANRVPLVVNGEIVGAYGSVIFRDMSDWKRLSAHVKTTMERIEQKFSSDEHHLYQLSDIVGESVAIRKLKETVRMIAPTKLPVVMEGETGTGKEMFAESIHVLSDCSDGPFVKVNCAVLPDEIAEQELLGSSDGKTEGKVHLAAGGTLYIEEIHALSIPLQAKLLRFIQQQDSKSNDESTFVRFVFSSNKNVNELVKSGQFREDLYYRIQSVYLRIPPLRDRMDDFSMIIRGFLHTIGEIEGRRNLKLDPKTLRQLSSYSWPGNVRELQNTLHAMVHMTEGTRLSSSSIPTPILQETRSIKSWTGKLDEVLQQTERQILEYTLANYSDKTEVAKQLGISRSTLYEKLKKYNL